MASIRLGAVELEPISDYPTGLGFFHGQSGINPKNLRLLPRLMEVLKMWNVL